MPPSRHPDRPPSIGRAAATVRTNRPPAATSCSTGPGSEPGPSRRAGGSRDGRSAGAGSRYRLGGWAGGGFSEVRSAVDGVLGRQAPVKLLPGVAGRSAGPSGVVAALRLTDSAAGLTLLALATTAGLFALARAAMRRGVTEIAVAGVAGSAACKCGRLARGGGAGRAAGRRRRPVTRDRGRGAAAGFASGHARRPAEPAGRGGSGDRLCRAGDRGAGPLTCRGSGAPGGVQASRRCSVIAAASSAAAA